MWKGIDSQEVGLEAAILERKRNSSLVESVCAEDSTGLSWMPKLGVHTQVCAVEERCVSLRRCVEKHAGGITSANADMSNDKEGERPSRRKPKVSSRNVHRRRVSRPLRRGRNA